MTCSRAPTAPATRPVEVRSVVPRVRSAVRSILLQMLRGRHLVRAHQMWMWMDRASCLRCGCCLARGSDAPMMRDPEGRQSAVPMRLAGLRGPVPPAVAEDEDWKTGRRTRWSGSPSMAGLRVPTPRDETPSYCNYIPSRARTHARTHARGNGNSMAAGTVMQIPDSKRAWAVAR